jgi:hypothetical protein
MNDIVIKSGEYDLTILSFCNQIKFSVVQIKEGKAGDLFREMEEHKVWLSEEETPEQWLRALASGWSTEGNIGIAGYCIYLSNEREFRFSGYGFTEEQIRKAIEEALPSEKPRMIFKAEDGRRYEWALGTMMEVE